MAMRSFMPSALLLSSCMRCSLMKSVLCTLSCITRGAQCEAHAAARSARGATAAGRAGVTHRDALHRLDDAVLGGLVVGEVRRPQPLVATLHTALAIRTPSSRPARGKVT